MLSKDEFKAKWSSLHSDAETTGIVGAWLNISYRFGLICNAGARRTCSDLSRKINSVTVNHGLAHAVIGVKTCDRHAYIPFSISCPNSLYQYPGGWKPEVAFRGATQKSRCF